MRVYILIFGILFLTSASFSGFSQENNTLYKHDTKIGIGYPGFYRVVLALSSFNNSTRYKPLLDLPFVNSDGNIIFPEDKKSVDLPEFIVSYNYALKKGLNIGSVIMYSSSQTSYQKEYNNLLYQVKEKDSYTSIIPNLYYYYLKKSKLIDLYIGADIGILLLTHTSREYKVLNQKKKNTEVIPSINICPFGIQLKTKVSPYLQVNLGSRGIVEGGINFKF